MPSADYGNAVGGGLKLKGAKDAGIKKQKKKKTPNIKHSADGDVTASVKEPVVTEESDLQLVLAKEEEEVDDGSKLEREEEVTQLGKTEAQKRHEERRRKRLDDRLKREGVKTHKERVEELNKYLSGLSEHHDMPRIGPG